MLIPPTRTHCSILLPDKSIPAFLCTTYHDVLSWAVCEGMGPSCGVLMYGQALVCSCILTRALRRIAMGGRVI